MSPWISWPLHAWPALLLTALAIVLLSTSKDPRTQRGNAVLVDLFLGFMTVGASVFWLRAVVLALT